MDFRLFPTDSVGHNLIRSMVVGQQNHSMVTGNFGEPHCCYRQVVVLNMFVLVSPRILGEGEPILTNIFSKRGW